MQSTTRLVVLGFLGWIPALAWAGDAAPSSGHDVTDLSLEDMLNTPVAVASAQARPLREVPSVVSVVTREEIVNSGARDLIDVLRLVPGIEFDGNVGGQVSPGIRGGISGKILFLIDGIDQAEHLFDALFFGNHYPIDNIDHIEIIRGGGSVIWGGEAEYAVINVITRNGAAINGISLSGIYGQMANGLDRRDLTLTYGQAFKNGLDISASGFIGQGKRSDRNLSDFYGSTVSFADANNNTLNPTFLNLAASYKGLTARFIYDNYNASTIDGAGLNLLNAQGVGIPANQFFTTYTGLLEYEGKITDNLTIKPRIIYWNQTPWQTSDPTSPIFFNQSTARWDGKIIVTYRVIEGLYVNLGAEAYTEHAWLNDPELAGTGFQTLFLGGAYAAFDRDLAEFGEVSWDSPWVNLTAGGRFEHNTVVGSAFVPRFAATKVLGKFHAKLLYSQSFYVPSFEEVALEDPNNPVRPEKTNLTEAEVGYEFATGLFARVNFFNLVATDTLVYTADPVTGVQAERNYKPTGSRGVEAEVRAKGAFGYVNLTYSFYTSDGINQAEIYQVQGQNGPLLGYSQHKFTLNANIKLPLEGLSLNPSWMVYSGKWGYLTQDGTNTGVGVLGQTPAGVLANLFVYYKPPPVKGLEVGIGVYNITNDPYSFVQAYNGGHAPMPAPSRDLVVKAGYTFGL